MNIPKIKPAISKRFRGFLPIVVDVETAGLNPNKDALLEIAAIPLTIDNNNQLISTEALFCHILPFEGARLDETALKITGIDPYHPFRFAVSESEAIPTLLNAIRKAVKVAGCQRAVLVGHNPTFDLSFLQAAVKRCGYQHDPFHPFTTLDTATLAALSVGHTVLAVALEKSGIAFDADQAHSALYDAQKTAELFCHIFNTYPLYK